MICYHAPENSRSHDGRDYINESLFAEIEEAKKVVIAHSNPDYRLTITLTPSAAGTLVSWSQLFASDKVAEGIARIVGPANEQNLDRLSAEVLNPKS